MNIEMPLMRIALKSVTSEFTPGQMGLQQFIEFGESPIDLKDRLEISVF
jgi:hypothetical protein